MTTCKIPIIGRGGSSHGETVTMITLLTALQALLEDRTGRIVALIGVGLVALFVFTCLRDSVA